MEGNEFSSTRTDRLFWIYCQKRFHTGAFSLVFNISLPVARRYLSMLAKENLLISLHKDGWSTTNQLECLIDSIQHKRAKAPKHQWLEGYEYRQKLTWKLTDNGAEESGERPRIPLMVAETKVDYSWTPLLINLEGKSKHFPDDIAFTKENGTTLLEGEKHSGDWGGKICQFIIYADGGNPGDIYSIYMYYGKEYLGEGENSQIKDW